MISPAAGFPEHPNPLQHSGRKVNAERGVLTALFRTQAPQTSDDARPPQRSNSQKLCLKSLALCCKQQLPTRWQAWCSAVNLSWKGADHLTVTPHNLLLLKSIFILLIKSVALTFCVNEDNLLSERKRDQGKQIAPESKEIYHCKHT